MNELRQPITIRFVTSPGFDANGRAQAESERSVLIYASIQPATGKTLDAVQHLRGNVSAFVLFTESPLVIPENGNPPRVKLFGDEYEVVEFQPWRNRLIDHFRLVVAKRAASETLAGAFA